MANSNPKTAVSTAAVARYILAVISAGIALGANADPFELKLHKKELWGVHEIEAGEYQAGIARLQAQLGSRPLVSSVQAPVLIDLCVAHIMANDLETATPVCEKAAGSKWYASIAYNNRGVLNVAKGHYEAAIRDFELAREAGGSNAVAERNLARAQSRLAAIRKQRQDQLAAKASTGTYAAADVTVNRDESGDE